MCNQQTCDYCGSPDGFPFTLFDKEGAPMCRGCYDGEDEKRIMMSLAKAKIQLAFGIPSDSEHMGEIDDWLFEVVANPGEGHENGEGCCDWIEELVPSFNNESMTLFVDGV